MTPAVSVVMPVRNAERTVAAAAQSILSQSLEDFELVCVDNGSTDRSARILRAVARTDPRMRLIEEPRRGIVPALSRGLSEARAGLIARMDADDVALAGRLAAQSQFMSVNQHVVAVGTAIVLEDADGPGQVITLPCTDADIRERLLQIDRCFVLAHPSAMIRRAALDAVGGYRAALLHAEDYDLWLRLAEHGRLANLPEPLLRYSTAGRDRRSDRYRLQQALSVTAALWCAHGRSVPGSHDPITGIPGPVADRDVRRLAGSRPLAFWFDHLYLVCANRIAIENRATRLAAALTALSRIPVVRLHAEVADPTFGRPWNFWTLARLSAARAALARRNAMPVPPWFDEVLAILSGRIAERANLSLP